MIKFDDFSEYSIKATRELGTDPDKVPYLVLTHSMCNQVVMDEFLSVSLIHVMQRALDHSRECDV